MTLLGTINAGLWTINAITWGFYAHSIPMAITSLLAAVGSVLLARQP